MWEAVSTSRCAELLLGSWSVHRCGISIFLSQSDLRYQLCDVCGSTARFAEPVEADGELRCIQMSSADLISLPPEHVHEVHPLCEVTVQKCVTFQKCVILQECVVVVGALPIPLSFCAMYSQAGAASTAARYGR